MLVEALIVFVGTEIIKASDILRGLLNSDADSAAGIDIDVIAIGNAEIVEDAKARRKRWGESSR